MAAEKKILLIGSGFVAGPCLNYLLRRPENKITVACRTISKSQALCNGHPNATPITLDVSDEAQLDAAVAKHDIVINLIPYIYHPIVIKSCIKNKKHCCTTSYVSPVMAEMDEAAKEAGVTCMNEIGIDPGVDHLYALKVINEVHERKGKIISFTSWCGGLPVPEDSNNPLGYKFSWSARGVLLALRNNARYLKDGKIVEIENVNGALMKSAKPVIIYPGYAFVGYPNRDSLSYLERYHIPEAKNCMRGTLRYQGFPEFAQALAEVGFLDDSPKDYLAKDAAPITWNVALAKLLGIEATDVASLKQAVTDKCHLSGENKEAILYGFNWLGLFSEVPVVQNGNALDCLCATLEQKLQYGPNERDLCVLQHKFEIEEADGTITNVNSTGFWTGVVGGDSAMATTVGLPCGIAVQLILDGVITRRGVIAPMEKDVYEPIRKTLADEGVFMVEEKW